MVEVFSSNSRHEAMIAREKRRGEWLRQQSVIRERIENEESLRVSLRPSRSVVNDHSGREKKSTDRHYQTDTEETTEWK